MDFLEYGGRERKEEGQWLFAVVCLLLIVLNAIKHGVVGYLGHARQILFY